MHKNKLLYFFNDTLNFHFENEINHGQMGIKSQDISSNPCNIKKIAVIRMDLDLEKSLKIDSLNQQKIMKFMNSNDFYIYLHKYLNNFTNQLEKFILRGMDIIHTFKPNELEKNEDFEYFFHGYNEINEISDLRRDLYSAILNVSRYLRNNLNPPYILMSDSKTYNNAENSYYGNNMNLISNIRINERIKWIDLIENADFGDDYKLVCISKNNQPLYNYPFCMIENKESPVNVHFANNKIIIYWGGALKIIDSDKIQRIKLNYNN